MEKPEHGNGFRCLRPPAGEFRPLPPGGTYVFTPKNAQSITYHSGANPALHAVVQVNQKFE